MFRAKAAVVIKISGSQVLLRWWIVHAVRTEVLPLTLLFTIE